MADDLKRVGLVFKEDGAVDFRKSLQLVNAELRENYNQFKLTQTQWDNSTKKATKLKDELQYLTNAYEIQKGKVETLRMQLNELEGAENKDTVAIQKKKAELTKAETSLQNYKNKIEELSKQLKITGEDITKLGENISKVGEKIENAGKKISVFSTATAGAFVASAKTAIDFEDAFTGVEKTVDATDEQLEEMKGQIRELAKEMPASTTEIAAVAEAAGQLGIKTENIMSFSKAMLDLGNSTNLTSDEAASSLAKFANVTQMSQENFDRLGATIVDLGNNFATTEANIVAMAMRLAGAGKQVGMSEAEIMGFATALSSVGIEAEMGGSALSKAMVKMQNAVETGGGKLNDILKKTGMSLKDLELMSANNSKDFKALSQSIGMTSTELKQFITAGTNLEDFAKVSGMTVEQFKKAWKEDATGALSAFIKGLGDAESKGDSAIAMLTEMGLTEVRLRDSLLRAANAGNLFNDAIETGRKAWEDNTALTNEANKRYDTLKSKLTMATNKIKDMGITLGNKLMPYIEKVVNWVDKLVKKFDSLNDEQVNTILKIGALVVAIGPVITILGKLISGVGTATKTVGMLKTAMEVMRGTITSTSTIVNKLSGVFSAMTSPVGLAITGIGALAGAYVFLKQQADKLPDSLQKIMEETNEAKQSHKEYRNELDKTASSSLAEIQNSENLRNELGKLVDENGKVKDGYKERVQFILTELNKALGTEYAVTGNVVDKYKELKEQIDLLILKKKAQIILENEEAKYTTAINNKNDAYQKMIDAQNEYNKALEGKTYEQYFEDLKQNYIDAGYTAEKSAEHAKDYMTKWIDGYKETYEANKGIYYDYLNDIAKYESDFTISQSDNTEKIKQMTEERINNYSRENLSKQEQINIGIQQELYNIGELKKLYEQDMQNQNEISAQANANAIKSGEERLQTLIQNLIAQTSTVNENAPEIINAWKELATNSYNTYYDMISPLDHDLKVKIEQMTGVTAEKTPELVAETQEMSQQVIDEVNKNLEFKEKALENLKGYLNGLEDTELRELLKEAGIENADKVIQGIKEGNLAEDQGMKILDSLNNGLKNKTWKDTLFDTARGIASTLSGLLTVKASVNGKKSALPGHKSGLDYVPYDDYVARLHKGERVLTAKENKSLEEAQKSSRKSNLEFSKSSNDTRINNIDYNRMTNAFLTALNKCKLTLDEDGFARIVKDELYKVV